MAPNDPAIAQELVNGTSLVLRTLDEVSGHSAPRHNVASADF